MKLSKIAAACCMSLAVTPYSFAQDIKGVVSNSEGKPIANAHVEVVNSKFNATTDSEGNFVISGLNAGNFELHVNAKSFSHKNRRVTIGENSLSGIDFQLHKSVIEVIDVYATPLHSSNIESANPISVLGGEELRLKQASTLGETLKNEVGVHSTYFGPVASSPIIRGMDGPRVLVTQNGLDAGDASRVGPDHLVTSETATAQQVEILRGPSTLFYGSGAIGGVVNVVDTRVPTTLDSSVDFMLKHNDVASEDEASFALNTSTGQLAFHLDGFWRDGDNYDIPGYAESENAHHEEEHDEHEEDHDEHEEHGEELGEYGTLPSSASKSSGFTVGTSYILDNGFVGFSVGQMTREYGIPGHSHDEHEEEHGEHEEDHDDHAEEEHEESVYADLEQTRMQMLSELTFEDSFFNKLASKVSYTDYEHKEIEDGEVGTTFKNEMTEARFDLFHQEYNGWKGAFSFNFKDSEFEAIGEEAFTPPSDTTSYAFAWLEEKHLSDNVLIQLGLRVEHVEIEVDDSMFEHHDEHEEHDEDEHEEHDVHFEKQEFDPISLSAGLVWEYEHGYNIGFSASYSQRAPSSAELFSNGPHIGTNSYELGALYEVHLEDDEAHFELGNQEVELETSKNIDLTFRKFEGDFGFVISAFYNQIDDYYFQANTGLFAEGGHDHDEHDEDHDEHDEDHDEHDEDHDEHEEEGLPVYIFQQHDVNMYGIEAEFVYQWNDVLKTTVFTDYIKAEIDGGANLPRISPMRFGGQLDYVENNFAANLSVTHYFDQDDVAELETETDGYTMVDANFNYYLDGIGNDFVIFVKANNITNEEARVHTSFLKDLAPLPARGFELGIRGSF